MREGRTWLPTLILNYYRKRQDNTMGVAIGIDLRGARTKTGLVRDGNIIASGKPPEGSTAIVRLYRQDMRVYRNKLFSKSIIEKK